MVRRLHGMSILFIFFSFRSLTIRTRKCYLKIITLLGLKKFKNLQSEVDKSVEGFTLTPCEISFPYKTSEGRVRLGC